MEDSGQGSVHKHWQGDLCCHWTRQEVREEQATHEAFPKARLLSLSSGSLCQLLPDTADQGSLSSRMTEFRQETDSSIKRASQA